MAGQIKTMLEEIIRRRANGNNVVASTTKTKLILRGLNPDRFTAVSPDDAAILAKVKVIAGELGVSL